MIWYLHMLLIRFKYLMITLKLYRAYSPFSFVQPRQEVTSALLVFACHFDCFIQHGPAGIWRVLQLIPSLAYVVNFFLQIVSVSGRFTGFFKFFSRGLKSDEYWFFFFNLFVDGLEIEANRTKCKPEMKRRNGITSEHFISETRKFAFGHFFGCYRKNFKVKMTGNQKTCLKIVRSKLTYRRFMKTCLMFDVKSVTFTARFFNIDVPKNALR